jgi:murein L,D-transpeptidase YcbB/YkuD
LEFAKALFNNNSGYKLVEERLALPDSETLNISVDPHVPVYLTYITCFFNERGKMVIRPDVYNRDEVLFKWMKNKLSE